MQTLLLGDCPLSSDSISQKAKNNDLLFLRHLLEKKTNARGGDIFCVSFFLYKI